MTEELLDDPLKSIEQTTNIAPVVNADTLGALNAPMEDVPEMPETPALASEPASITTDTQTDFGQTTGDAASDITGLLSQDSPYMERARTSGKQYANERGMLNTTMGAQAAEAAAIDAAMPIVQMQSQERGQSRQMAHDIVMQNLDTDSRASLIDLEQSWNAKMASNKDMAEAWNRNVDAIGKMLTAGLTVEQTNAGLDVMMGPVGPDGVRTGGTMGATMTFIDSLNNFTGTGQGVATSPDQSPITGETTGEAAAQPGAVKTSTPDAMALAEASKIKVHGLSLGASLDAARKELTSGLPTTEKRRKLAEWIKASQASGFDHGYSAEDLKTLAEPRNIMTYGQDT